MEKLNRATKYELETFIYNIMEDLRTQNPKLAEKYKDEIDGRVYYISPEDANQIVRGMKPFGEKFTREAVKSTLLEKHVMADECTLTYYYLTMNMVCNDYNLLFEKYPTINNKEVYYLFSKCFIDDIDAPKYKVNKYFLMK